MIGVYDSGYGGLTVLRALRAALPQQDFCYLGDSGRAPYGGRDTDTLLDFAEQCTERLFEEGCPLIVVACHTISCVALRHLQRKYVGSDIGPGSRRILGVTIPAAQAAVEASSTRAGEHGHIAVLGTLRTIASGTFGVEVAKLGPQRVTARAAPLLAPLVEEGWENTEIARMIVERYVRGLDDADTLVLACTHYPLLLPAFRQVLAPQTGLLDPSDFIAARLVDWLERHPGFVPPGQAQCRVLCTGDPALFRRHGEHILGAPLPEVQHIAEQSGRLTHLPAMRIPQGQVVR